MLEAVKRGARKAFVIYLDLLKIIIPVYVGVIFLKYTGVINWLAEFTEPVMKVMGLPGEAVLALLTGYFLNIYGAVGVIAGLELGVKEITILATMLGIAHSLIIEAAVLKKISGKLFSLVGLRISLSVVVGILLNLIL